jgi:hypothetical protein
MALRKKNIVKGKIKMGQQINKGIIFSKRDKTR